MRPVEFQQGERELEILQIGPPDIRSDRPDLRVAAVNAPLDDNRRDRICPSIRRQLDLIR